MKVQEIIFGSTDYAVEAKLQEIKESIKYNDFEVIERNSRDTIETNVRRIKAVVCSESLKGYKCSKAYVDEDLPIKYLRRIIYPTLNNPNTVGRLEDNIHYF